MVLFLLKALHGIGHNYPSELLVPYNSGYQGLFSASDTSLLAEPPTFLVTVGDRRFQKAGPCLWNSLRKSDTEFCLFAITITLFTP